MTRRLTLLFLAVVASAGFALADVAWACSCIRFQSAAEQFARSDAVFRGRVVKTERTGPMQAVTTFEVVERLKGGVGRRVKVRHGTETGGACGVVFKRGQVAELTAHRGERGVWQTSSCARPQFDWAEFRRAAKKR